MKAGVMIAVVGARVELTAIAAVPSDMTRK